MSSAGQNATVLIRKQWKLLSGLPGGKRVFSRMMGIIVPYTGTIGARVEELRDGYARVLLPDRRAVRNHLSSVHAIALANLAELAGNLAVLYSAPEDTRMIVAGISLEYLKKARGDITGECTCEIPGRERKEYVNEVVMKDRAGEIVARAQLRSLVGPKK
ncbi:MAG TPA: hotdog fold domain-containing protein [Myxococcaceae bacterium]|nr:hotdog fold domain-containing protein [Myxococcaceae bacterium]